MTAVLYWVVRYSFAPYCVLVLFCSMYWVGTVSLLYCIKSSAMSWLLGVNGGWMGLGGFGQTGIRESDSGIWKSIVVTAYQVRISGSIFSPEKWKKNKVNNVSDVQNMLLPPSVAQLRNRACFLQFNSVLNEEKDTNNTYNISCGVLLQQVQSLVPPAIWHTGTNPSGDRRTSGPARCQKNL